MLEESGVVEVVEAVVGGGDVAVAAVTVSSGSAISVVSTTVTKVAVLTSMTLSEE